MTDSQSPAPGTPQTSAKAIVGGIVAFIALTAQGLVPLLPDPAWQLGLSITLVVVGALGAAFGIYQTPNRAKIVGR